MRKLKKDLGFSLIETLLVIGIVSIFSFIKMQEVQEEQLSMQAKTLAEQMQQIGQATNAYINLNYDKISAMNNIPNGKDGPLTCDKNIKTCVITIETLKNDFLLPEQFTGLNLMKSGYDITLKVEGTAPNYQINGLIVTDKGLNLKQNKNAILLGKTIQYAGIDSGFSKTNNEISGLAGAWKESATKYNTIKEEGQLAYQVGYSSNMYSVYLRRDGTLPMTGDLNLDEHNIKNIANAYIHKDLFVDGKADVKGDITSDKVVRAKSYFEGFNGTNDGFRIGGNDGNDYEFALYNNTKPLTIWRPNAPASSNIILNTYGGIETKNGGQILASGNITSQSNIKGQTLESVGRTKVGEFLELTEIAKVNTTCEKNGLVGRDNKGTLMSCINLKWLPADFYATPIGSPMAWPSNTVPAGWLAANGQTFDKGRYPLLAQAYPSGRLPDLRGQFIRGLDNGRGLDKGRVLLSEQADTQQKGALSGSFDVLTGYDGGNAARGMFKVTRYYSSGIRGGGGKGWGRTIEINDDHIRTSTENRPTNIAFNYIIRAE